MILKNIAGKKIEIEEIVTKETEKEGIFKLDFIKEVVKYGD